jgi:protein-L-isoaspartate(D-aspartate) O-methyltransferase
MLMDLAARRRFFAEEIEAIAHLTTPALVEALATVPREAFLGPGPWTVRGETAVQGAPRRTPDADPRHVYHNLVVAIDLARQLFNGAPSVLASAIDSLGLSAGDRVLHVGAGTGYYTALMAHVAGAGGRVLALEVDEGLAAAARTNLSAMPWVEVRHGDGSEPLGESFDAIMVNAGVTHPLDAWLDALAPAGRMILPLTVVMAPTLGKGLLVRVARTEIPDVFDARVNNFVAIYSAVGIRDEARNEELAAAMRSQPMPPLTQLRRDPHEPSPWCWLHHPGCCWTTGR